MFHSQERFAIAHSYSEKIKFLKQKIVFFFSIQSSCFIQKWAFLTHFCHILNFGLLVWSICVTPKLFDITVYSPPKDGRLTGRYFRPYRTSLTTKIFSLKNYLWKILKYFSLRIPCENNHSWTISFCIELSLYKIVKRLL